MSVKVERYAAIVMDEIGCASRKAPVVLAADYDDLVSVVRDLLERCRECAHWKGYHCQTCAKALALVGGGGGEGPTQQLKQ